jgi:hypothetical protein
MKDDPSRAAPARELPSLPFTVVRSEISLGGCGFRLRFQHFPPFKLFDQQLFNFRIASLVGAEEVRRLPEIVGRGHASS